MSNLLKKMVSLGKFFYYIIGLVTPLKGGWLHTDPTRDEERPLSDPRISGGTVEDATQEEVVRYYRVMSDRYRDTETKRAQSDIDKNEKPEG